MYLFMLIRSRDYVDFSKKIEVPNITSLVHTTSFDIAMANTPTTESQQLEQLVERSDMTLRQCLAAGGDLQEMMMRLKDDIVRDI